MGPHAVAVTLRPAGGCRVDRAIEVPSDEVGMQRFEEPERLPPELRTTRTYLFPGGCVTYQFAFGPKADAAMVFAADSALAFQSREPLVALVDERTRRAAPVRRRRSALPRRHVSDPVTGAPLDLDPRRLRGRGGPADRPSP